MGVILYLILLANSSDNGFLPRWMTPEESLKINETGKGHITTPPPSGWIETPNEFESLRGVFVTWLDIALVRPIFREIIREVSEVCKAYIIAKASDTLNIKNYLVSNSISLDSVGFYVYPYEGIWIRDYGPWFIRKQDNTEGIIDFIYYPSRPNDDSIPLRIGNDWGIQVHSSPLIHSGGNFMVDGLGTGFTSTLIYDDSAFTPRQIDSLMLAYNGIKQFITLPRINIEYTGHIDLWAKILNDTLVMVGEYAPGHPNYTLLNQNADSITRCKNCEGYNYRVVRIPMPWDTSDAPPSYLNSLIVNNKVLVPLYGLPEDDTAMAVYQQVLPAHEVVGIDCSALFSYGGAIHCITMQVPGQQYIHIRHEPLSNTDSITPYRVRAQIMTSGNLLPESTLLFYKINSTISFNTESLITVTDSPGVYTGYIPSQSIGDTVYYYLLVKNNEEIRRTSPVNAPIHIYSFLVTPEIFIAEENTNFIPLLTIFPNPSYNKINFSLKLPEATKVKIEIYNALGKKIKTLTDGLLNMGKHNIQWNFRDDMNRKISQGIYFYRIITNQKIKTGKIVLIR